MLPVLVKPAPQVQPVPKVALLDPQVQPEQLDLLVVTQVPQERLVPPVRLAPPVPLSKATHCLR